MEHKQIVAALHDLEGVYPANDGDKCIACGKDARNICVFMSVQFPLCGNYNCEKSFLEVVYRFNGSKR